MRFRRWQKVSAALIAVLLLAAGTGLGVKTKAEAHRLVTNPRETRKVPGETPANRGMAFEDVSVTTTDGLRLAGWFIPSAGRALVMVVHGYKEHRGSVLGVAAILQRHGYAVLVTSLRGHDRSDGETISFGAREMQDLAAWYAWVRTRPEVDPALIGMFGVSMGATIAIRFMSENPGVRALVADCAFSSVEDTVETSVEYFTGLPPFPFASLILFWMERELGVDSDTIDAKRWIPNISPRPVFLLQGGADIVVSPESGERLYQAARQPKELWFEPELGHAEFLKKRPKDFELRISEFFKKHLRES
jgi:uncharacterized protein